MTDLTYAVIKELVRYDETSGKLFWLPRALAHCRSQKACDAWNRKMAGKEAMACVNSQGYKHGTILSRSCVAHRVVWLLVTGEWPVGVIDHFDRDKGNNRFPNLRDVNKTVNSHNAKRYKTNKSGFTGISWHNRDRLWRVRLTIAKRSFTVGYSKTIEGAIEKRAEAREKHGTSGYYGSDVKW